MAEQQYSQLRESIEVGFFDANYSGKITEQYLPQLLTNNEQQAKKVVDQLVRELKQAQYFWFSVAFMTTSGVAILKQELAELAAKGIKGKILVSQYQNFTQPQALREILKLPNVELRMATQGNYHAKGYLFDRDDNYTLIIGSSNFTASALTQNQEWNLKVVTTKAAKLAQEALQEFEAVFEEATVVDEAFIDVYETIYQSTKTNWRAVVQPTEKIGSLQPNLMQKQALRALDRLYDAGEKRALLVSATGTGKTYLSAFHVQKKQPKRFLFLVHRENIARAALQSYQRVLGGTVTLGMYTGNQKDEADYLFATTQTMTMDEHLQRFSPTFFDYIVIDETHRAGAKSYQKIIDYFQPQFLLGMTATPERTDGFDIFSQFDHNLAYEIRLHEALSQDMLSPFHYYGVSELTLDGEIIDEKSEFNRLVVDERVNYMHEQMQFYGCDDGEVRGLVFCSRNDEAQAFSQKLNAKGLRTLALSGTTTEEKRQEAIERLELPHNHSDKLDYLLSVDIFNEGIDIPAVNQVVMLRPTQSAIIFVQQLGRGLRKTKDKEYLTVIDFIGNYANNFLVPIALFGDKSYNKDRLRQLVVKGTNSMPSTCSVHFDEIAKKQIFTAINQSNLQTRKRLVEDYRLLEYQLGYQPLMMDFVRFGARDPYQYVDANKSYYHFVKSLKQTNFYALSESAEELLRGWQSEVCNGVRISEVILLELLLVHDVVTKTMVAEQLQQQYELSLSEAEWQSCLLNCELKFVREKHEKQLVAYAQKYNLLILEKDDQQVAFTDSIRNLIAEGDFKKWLLDTIAYAHYCYKQRYNPEHEREGFILQQKYTRKDVFRILNWQENPVAQNVGGYMINPEKTNCPIFVTYHKAETVSETSKYEDQFLSESVLEWYSKNGRTLASNDVKTIVSTDEEGLRLPLFVKKSDDEGLDFYYLGDMKPIPGKVEPMTIAGKNVVQIHMHLQDPVDEKLYEYLTSVEE